MKRMHILAAALALSVLFLVPACTPRPPKVAVEDLISGHFKERGYNVKTLRLGDIMPSPGDKVYMATRAYVVPVKLIVLEPAAGDEGKTALTFTDATITVRQDMSRHRWIISDIEGMPVP